MTEKIIKSKLWTLVYEDIWLFSFFFIDPESNLIACRKIEIFMIKLYYNNKLYTYC